MESVKPSQSQHKSKLARTIAKVLSLRSAGISPATDEISKPKKPHRDRLRPKKPSPEEEEERAASEAVLAKLFAGVSAVKSAYAELQLAQTPYDTEGIQSADESVVTELKSLSELKRCYLKKQFDPSPEIALVKAEIQEQKSLLKTYETTAKKLEYQARVKETELASLREKLEEVNAHNKSIEKRLKNQSGLENLHFSGLSPVHFSVVLRQVTKSIESFSKMICEGMRSSGWDLRSVARTIQPETVFCREDHQHWCFAVESFVSREMFEGFNFPNFHSPREDHQQQQRQNHQNQRFFARFSEVRSARTASEYLTAKPKSGFASFCRNKYSKLIHPKMEFSLASNLETRTKVLAGEFSSLGSSELFTAFSEMARRFWILHCLAFSFNPEALIFGVSPGCRFSEVYMESVAEDYFPSSSHSHSSSSSSMLDNINSNNKFVAESESQVAFTVIPGFRIGKTVIQSKVYLSQTILGRR